MMLMIKIIKNSIEIFDRLFIKIRGVISEISRSKIRNRMVIMKKLTENGTLRMVFSLNPHSKFMLTMLCFLVLFIFMIMVMIIRKFEIMRIINIRFIILINSLSF